MTDYYETLGLSRDATTDEIKRAYRKLARELHPDVSGNDPASEERFKEVSRAYEVLSNPEKRRAYEMGADPASPNGGGQGGFGNAPFGFQDIFETFFAGAGGGQSGPVPRARRGQDALLRMDVEMAESVFGLEREITVDTAIVCSVCEGNCCRPGTSPQTCSVCNGRGVVQRVARSFLGQVMTTVQCAACSGFGTIIPEPCTECSGEGRVRTRRTLTVKVPAGVDTGTRIKLSGQSEVGPGGGPAGDLYIEIREKNHPMFTRKDDDLHCTVELPMTAAALGTVVNLTTFDGERPVDIRPGTQFGDVVTLRDLGVGHLRGNGRGDLLVHVEVTVPTKLDDDQINLLKSLAIARDEEMPEAKVSAAHPGVFSKLRDKLSGR